MVCTEDKLHFYRTAADNLVDIIPLHEIIHLSEIKKFGNKPSPKHLATTQSSRFLARAVSKSNLALNKSNSGEKSRDDTDESYLLIKKIADGFNSGRAYHFQAKSLEQCQTVVQVLSKAVEIAKAKVEDHFLVRSAQAKVKMIYDTMAFQIMAAFLIIAVRIRTHISCTTLFERTNLHLPGPSIVFALRPLNSPAEFRDQRG